MADDTVALYRVVAEGVRAWLEEEAFERTPEGNLLQDVYGMHVKCDEDGDPEPGSVWAPSPEEAIARVQLSLEKSLERYERLAGSANILAGSANMKLRAIADLLQRRDRWLASG